MKMKPLREAILCLDDFEALARKRLPRPLFGYVSGATERQQSLQQNQSSFAAIDFLPHTCVDVRQRSIDTSLFGRRYSAPFGIAPMGLIAASAYRGDAMLARAAHAANVPMILSGSSLVPLEEIAAQYPAVWFQTYLPAATTAIEALFKRVQRAGIDTLVITLDLAVGPSPENASRAGFSMPFRITPRLVWDVAWRPRWLLGTWCRTLIKHGIPHFENAFAERGRTIFDPAAADDFGDSSNMDWQRFKDIRKKWPGCLVLKGLLNPDDARQAASLGADGIIVSNHGGRQLDGAVAPLRILPRMLEAAGTMPVMLDGGVRRGSDVLKALALGAKLAFVGRPFTYAVAIGGAQGATHGIGLLKSEIERNLGLLGVTAIDQLHPDLLWQRPG